jgi:UDP-N-acetylmuramate: L-alanyl-gamma-D-glutamyl-meso-diaminopimelate ligase
MARKIHIIGIAGAGVSAVAVMLKDLGNTVTGSDEGFYEPTISYLKRHGINILTPYKKENVPNDADLIIIGKHSKLNVAENEEVALAMTMQNKVQSFPQVLGEITKDRENIVVAGSYGKSTCSALLSWCLSESGKDAGYFFGAIPIGFDENAHIGTEKQFVLEGDEYPAFGGHENKENKSKFLYMHPKDVILTSAEHDHVNIFPTVESYTEPYKKLVALLPTDGLLVVGINNPNVADIAKECKAKVVTYGMDKSAQWGPADINYGAKTTFGLHKAGEKIVELSTSLLGTHNIENIVGVSAYLLEKNLISVEDLKNTVESFGGLKRRLDLKTDKSSVLVYEGFGSSYKKAKTVFDALKLHFPNKRIITVFEPHTFSWRNKNNLDWYNDIFADSDETIIFNPPQHGSATHDQASLTEILKAARKNTKNIYGVESKAEALKILEEKVKSEDIIILMSSGDLGGLIEEIPAWAEKKFPRP